MILESGFIVAAGLILIFLKLSWKVRLMMLGHPLALDLGVFALLNALHWGTFSGVMVAATGALVCSGLISLGRKVFGYVQRGAYFPGYFNMIGKLK